MIILLLANVSGLLNKGNKFFKEGKFDSALFYYNEAEMLSPNNPYANFNKGTALYKIGKYDEAIESFKKSLASKKKAIKKNSFFNLGNSYFKKGDIENAIKSYINTLKIDPDDIDAKKNLELIMKLPKKEKEKEKENKEKEEKNDEKVEQNLQVLKEELKKMMEDYLKQQKKGGSYGRDW